MGTRVRQTLKAASLIFVALVAWVGLQLTVGHSWHEETTIGVPVKGVTRLW